MNAAALLVTLAAGMPAAATGSEQPAAGAPAASMQMAGRQRLKVWGLPVYDATLWVGAGFRHDHFAGHAFALELAYLRAFSASDIARRSLEEMRRAGDFSPAQEAQWRGALATLLPDVRPGDRITGVHRPGRGARFLLNGRLLGDIDDERFAQLFFAIWLGPRTSEPALRQALIAGTSP